jgi:hypothetical protein
MTEGMIQADGVAEWRTLLVADRDDVSAVFLDIGQQLPIGAVARVGNPSS